MNENIRFAVADSKAEKLTAALGISDDRSKVLIDAMTDMVDKDMKSKDESTMLGADGILAALSEIAETPQELAFVSYALNSYIHHAQICPFHGNRPLEGIEDLGELLQEVFGGRRERQHPLEGLIDALNASRSNRGAGMRSSHLGKGVIIIGGRRRG